MISILSHDLLLIENGCERCGEKIEKDILYLDSPYNTAREYGYNYRLLEILALYDDPPTEGKNQYRTDMYRFAYCKKKLMKEVFEDLIMNVKAKGLFLNYNDEWMMQDEDFKQIFEKHGTFDVKLHKHRRYKVNSIPGYRPEVIEKSYCCVTAV